MSVAGIDVGDAASCIALARKGGTRAAADRPPPDHAAARAPRARLAASSPHRAHPPRPQALTSS